MFGIALKYTTEEKTDLKYKLILEIFSKSFCNLEHRHVLVVDCILCCSTFRIQNMA